MRYEQLRSVFARIGVTLPPPNSAGWCHIPCVFAGWKHRSGKDRSAGMAVKVEERGTSAFSCPACKSHGRIEGMLRELGRLRGEDFSGLITEVSTAEADGAFYMPPWDQRHTLLKDAPEILPPPLDPDLYDPELTFDHVRDHDEAVAFLRSRHISPAGAVKAGIRFDPDKRRLVFPVYDDKGNLYGYSGRTVIPDYHPKVLDYANLPKRLLILGEHRWQAGRPIVLVEGLFAYARFLTEGVDEDWNVGAMLGSAMTEGKAKRLRNWGVPIYLFLDMDEAGRDGIYGPVKQFGVDRFGQPNFRREVEKGAIWALVDHVPVYVPTYPPGVNDPDFLVRAQIETALRGAEMEPKPRPSVPPKRKENPNPTTFRW